MPYEGKRIAAACSGLDARSCPQTQYYNTAARYCQINRYLKTDPDVRIYQKIARKFNNYIKYMCLEYDFYHLFSKGNVQARVKYNECL